MKNKKASAIWQVFLLVTMIFAVSFMIGSELKEVSANFPICESNWGGTCFPGDPNNQTLVSSLNCLSALYLDCPENQFCCTGLKEVQTSSTPPPTAADTNIPQTGTEKDKGKSTEEVITQVTGTINAGMTVAQAYQYFKNLVTGANKDKLTQEAFQKAFKEYFKNGKLTDAGVRSLEEMSKSPEKVKGVAEEVVKESTKKSPFGSGGSWSFKDYFLGGGEGSSWWQAGQGVSGAAQIAYTAAVAMGVKSLVVQIFKWAKTNERNLQIIKDAGTIAVLGATAWTTIMVVAGSLGPAGWVVGGAVALFMLGAALFMGQQFSTELFSYQVQVWQPGDGGENCEKCNVLPYGCSEYQCHSYGQSCILENKGTKYETCVWENKNDMNPPVMKPMESVLKPGYRYTPIDAAFLGTGDTGVNIEYTQDPEGNGCIPAFTSVTLGLETNEPAECKIDIDRPNNYSAAKMFFSEGPVKVYNHTLVIPAAGLPGSEAVVAAGWQLESAGTYTFYMRCKDRNGQTTNANFAMHFCIQKGPDMQAPIIEGTNYLSTGEYTSASYVAHGKTDGILEVYTNEPADCKWDFQDREYSLMENNMSDCSQGINNYLYPNSFTYGCRTNLTGIKAGASNLYYIRCQDKPWLKTTPISGQTAIANKQSHILTLKGTFPLQIDSLKVNGMEDGALISDSVSPTVVSLVSRTSAGANEGKATCRYNVNGGSFYDFATNLKGNYLVENKVDLWLGAGTYTTQVVCNDEGGNVANQTISFRVELDTSAPQVARLYYEEGKLKIITNEKAECVYSTSDCNYAFEDGIELISLDRIEHFLQWNTELDLFVKCRDGFGNQPIPQNSCSVVVRAFE